ncbi:unnamed protein product [Ambrosiozyma monospora]|uniref:Unnamed protein product n=1 Tax=Ambrosiozyma monospora TaxID=43982 RepID=A0ACB5TCV0_AMBMO|nr:unnamed protein product [Ambrosiozyma monospora]
MSEKNQIDSTEVISNNDQHEKSGSFTALSEDKTDGEVIETHIDPVDRPIDHKLERRICRKFDMRILPTIAFMYLCNSLDKGNISNAKTNGLDDDIGLHGNQWNLILCIFFVPYVLFAFPFQFLVRKFNPANVTPIMMCGFGSMTLLSCSVFNFSSFMAARWFLGMCEAAFFPGIIYYLSTFYRRNELARRLGLFYAASNIANAFSGLLSYGVFQINTHRLKGWQILFLIEGGFTVIFALFAFFYLPRTVSKCSFLTEEETECAIWRIESDSSSKSSSQATSSLREAASILKHPLPYLWVLAEFCIVVPLNSVNNWFPQIIQNLGHGPIT